MDLVSVLPTLLLILVVDLLVYHYIQRSLKHSLSGLNVFITGCDHGLGYDLALALNKQGMHVYAGCLTESGAKQLSSLSINTIPLDVTSDSSVSNAAEAVHTACPDGLFAVINNAGVYDTFLVEMTPISAYHRVMDVNFLGTVRVCQQFCPLVKQQRGRFISISSFMGKFSTWSLSAYSCSKHALEAFHDSFRVEMRQFGVQVSLIAPGTMNTQLTHQVTTVMRTRWNEADADMRQRYGEQTLHRVIPRVETIMRCMAQSTTPVIEAIIDCLSSAPAPSRWYVGWDSFIAACVLPHLCLPDWLLDRVVSILAGMPSAT